MGFDPENQIVKLCVKGMEHEGKGEMQRASELFLEAWDNAKSDFEKFTAAHYVARHQDTMEAKLKWDTTALNFALEVENESIQSTLPSLYLNIGKCHEDLNDMENAAANYNSAKSYFDFLPENGYGNMIKNGVENGIKRVEEKRTANKG